MKVKVVDLYSASTRSHSKAHGCNKHCQGITVTVYSFVVYMYLIVSVDCIGFDHIVLYSAIFAASMSINVQYSVRDNTHPAFHTQAE